MATTASLLPNQQQQQQPPQIQEEVPYPYPQAVPSNAWHNNNNNNNNKGSVGPFFAVISVLAVLSIISCIVGRFWIGKEETPLESIKHRGSCFGWLNCKCRRSFGLSGDAAGCSGGGDGGRRMAAAAAAPLPDERGYGGGN